MRTNDTNNSSTHPERVRSAPRDETDWTTAERRRAADGLSEAVARLARKNRYETILGTVIRSIHRSLELQEVWENAVESMNKNMEGVDNVSIYLVEEMEAVLRAYRGYPDWYIEKVRRIPYPEGFTWKTIIDGTSTYVADVEHDTVIHPAGREVGTKSYLSIPIRVGEKVVGCININSFGRNAFDGEDLKLLENVACQIEIAINNARQAEALRESNLLQHLAAGTASATGTEFFRSLVRHLASALGVRYAFVAQCTDITLTRVRTLAFWKGSEFGENVEYALAGTPCEKVIGGSICYYPSGIQELFPLDKDLGVLRADGYLGVPIRDSWENILGHLAALDDKPMEDEPRGMSILQIFAARAGAELARKRAEDALRDQFARLAKKNRYETIISTVTRAVHQSINPRDVFENAVDAMSKHIDRADAVGIYLVEEQGAVLKAFRGFTDGYLEAAASIPHETGYTWKVIAEGKPRYCADVDYDTFPDLAERQMGIGSYLSMPVRPEGKTVGAINILSSQRNAFDEEDLRLLEMVAGQIETAMKNAQQAEALRAALDEVDALKTRLQAENVYLQEEIRTQHGFEEIVGRSTALQKVLRQVEQVAPTDTTVLITGETGTGKELVARAIHNLSPRAGRPLIAVNCGAIAPGLVESELFGHEKGAFTGALARKLGRFELADGGTIFLDEIGDLSPELQVKLLRALQEGEIERVGGTRPIRVDVRVIAATHQDLEEAVEGGRFRADLFYRLNVFPIRVPPLRERKADIPLLVRHFAAKYASKMGKRIDSIPRSTLDALTDYPWPGNVRELTNLLERSVIISRGTTLELGEQITPQRIPEGGPTQQTLEEIGRQRIREALQETGWRVSGPHGAAALLGLKPTTLEARMKKLGITRPK